MSDVLEILVNARELISDYARWAQFTMAIDGNGNEVEADDPDACSWCAVGAVAKVHGGTDVDLSPTFAKTIDALNLVALDWYGTSAMKVNDTESHQIVIRMFDEAIEIIRGER